MLQEHRSRPLWARELKLPSEKTELVQIGRAPCGRVN